jgi:PTH1 family peptidyl-tRNA hydrolase
MILIIGLGNPGRKYQKTRHNVGFWVIEEFKKENDFPQFKFSKKSKSKLSIGFLGRKKIILAKPQTLMNNSGKAAKELISVFKSRIPNLWVVHDDIDLPLGKIRISRGKGAAGHKGIQSIIDQLGTKNFVRFRVGILPKWGKPKKIEKFVLKNFTKKEEEIAKKVIKKTISALETALSERLEKASQEFNK